MSSDVDQLRAEIDATRADLVNAVDELAERADPRRAARRGLDGLRQRLAVLPLPRISDPREALAALPDQIGGLAARLPEAVWSTPRRLFDLPGQVVRAPRTGLDAARRHLRRLWCGARSRLLTGRPGD